TAREVRLFLLAPSRISEKLDELYKPEMAIDKLLEGMGDTDLQTLSDNPPPEELNISEADAQQKPVVRLVDMIISEGILSRASDIHVEPEEGGVAVRYRIDGVLRQVMKIPRQAGLPLISRIKIMSSLDIADRLRPQDGRARVAVNGQPIDLRVSTLPAQLGEKVVIRILDSRATVKSLDSLGLNPGEGEAIKRLLENHEGILLVTGPTGSGKTTTLYSAINQIKSEESTSSRSKTRSNTGCRGSCRCRCRRKPASPSPRRCGPSCGRTPTSSWWARFATRRRHRSPCRHRSG